MTACVRHMVVGIAMAALGAAAIAQPQQAPSLTARDDAVVFEGQINARSAAEFISLLQDPRITRLVITSRGGSVAAALDMATAVADRQLDVEVPTACLSSCANYIFPAGRRKRIGHPAAVAWHGNMAHVLYLQQHGMASWDDQQLRDARALALRELALYRRIGVDGFVCWFGKIAPYDVPDFYFLSTSDMERFGIGHVTVDHPSADATGSNEVRPVHVDWITLEAIRPTVRLTD